MVPGTSPAAMRPAVSLSAESTRSIRVYVIARKLHHSYDFIKSTETHGLSKTDPPGADMRHAGRTQGFFARSRRCWLAAASRAAFAAGPVAARAPASGEPIRIGSLLSVTGGLASVGLPEREGMLGAPKGLNP